jgi:hypothetical protein
MEGRAALALAASKGRLDPLHGRGINAKPRSNFPHSLSAARLVQGLMDSLF